MKLVWVYNKGDQRLWPGSVRLGWGRNGRTPRDVLRRRTHKRKEREIQSIREVRNAKRDTKVSELVKTICELLKNHDDAYQTQKRWDLGTHARNREDDHFLIDEPEMEKEEDAARKQGLSSSAGQPQLGSMFTGLGQRSLMVEYPEDDSAQYMCRSCLAARFIYN
jgi:hypothetical protein